MAKIYAITRHFFVTGPDGPFMDNAPGFLC